MLSYRHAFHAGGFADVLKHTVLVEILLHLRKKDRAFAYVDTHAGAGLYDLHAAHAATLQEYRGGIGRLNADEWPELASYLGAVRAFNPTGELTHYPGSAVIAMHFLRQQDHAWLYELHPDDFAKLQAQVRRQHGVRVEREDGFERLRGLLPPSQRRGLVLIDPSYEIKTDYDRVVDTLNAAVGRFATGIYAIWYPVVERQRIDLMEERLADSGIKRIQRFELAVAEDAAGHGMTAAGMIVVNPPWGLFEKLSSLLPKLARALAAGDGAASRCDVLAGE